MRMGLGKLSPDSDDCQEQLIPTMQSQAKYDHVPGKVQQEDDEISLIEDGENTRCCQNCGLCQLCRQGCYSVYVLHIMLFSYLVNQLDRYMLAVVTKPMAQDIEYGDIVCMTNDSYSSPALHGVTCNGTNEASCEALTNPEGDQVCEWNYNGQGFEYQLLAGPIFIVIYTFAGIFLGLAADYYNRKNLLSACILFWSTMSILTGLVQEYWQLAVLRFGLGMGQAGFSALASSLIGTVFQGSLLAMALGYYNCGIYLGFGLSFAVGNWITELDIMGQGWRMAFYISGIPGIVLGTLCLFTIKEPERRVRRGNSKDTADPRDLLGRDVKWWEKLATILKHFATPSLLMICLAGSIRNAAGYVWAYNAQVYYESLGRSAEEIGTYLSWIPMLAGSTSVVIGGLIADKVVAKRGPNARLVVIAASQILAAPFAAGAILLEPPGAYYMLIPTYMIGEVWIGVTLAVLIELVPTALRTTSVALYLFIISNIGGNAPLIVPSLQTLFTDLGASTTGALRDALLVLFPGEYALSAVLYLLTLFVIRRDIQAAASYQPITGETATTIPPITDEEAPLEKESTKLS